MKLKEKIKKIVANKKPDFKTLDFITKSKSDAVSNNSMDLYRKLGAVEHSLYRYNSFLQANLNDEAEKEAENLNFLTEDAETGNVTLYGGVSNTVYRWETEPNACEKCQELDGTEYDNKEDIPEKPHPNCKCKVVEVNNKTENKNSGDCDCVDVFENIIQELQEIVDDAENLSSSIEQELDNVSDNITKVNDILIETDEALQNLEPEFGKHLPDCENNIDNIYGVITATKEKYRIIFADLFAISNRLFALLNVVRIFVSNYFALLYEAYGLKQAGMDKYRHSKANCEAAQQAGAFGMMVAEGLSDLKEYYDQFTYVYTHGVTVEEAIADSERDQIANRLGRERGRKYPYCPCSILMDDLKPKN